MSSSLSSVPDIFIEAPVIIFLLFRSLGNNNVPFSLALNHKPRKLVPMCPALGTSSVPTTPIGMRPRQFRRQL
jgi:hypothetical protein